jgi:hypothetical protein
MVSPATVEPLLKAWLSNGFADDGVVFLILEVRRRLSPRNYCFFERPPRLRRQTEKQTNIVRS